MNTTAHQINAGKNNHVVIFALFFGLLYLLITVVPVIQTKVSDTGKPPLSWQGLLFLLLVFLLLSLAYVLLYRQLGRLQFGIKHIIVGAVIFSLILALMSPLGSGDVYYYIFHSRALVKYHVNPYTADLNQFSSDPFYVRVSSWGRDYGTTYGPLWLLISAPAGILSSNNEFTNLFFFRMLAILFHLGTIFLLFRILGKTSPSHQLTGTLLYAWNPLILFEVANNGHNEIMIIFFLLLAFWFYLQKKNNFILPCVVAAVLIKYYALIFLPIFIWLIWRNEANIRQKLLTITKSIAPSFILVLVAFLPFWQGVKIFQGTLIQMQAVSLPNFFPLAILQKVTASPSSVMQIIGLLVLLLFYVYSFFRPAGDTSGYLKKIFWLYFVYIFFVAMYFQPWYLLGLVTLLILIPDRKYQTASLVISSFGLLVYSFYH